MPPAEPGRAFLPGFWNRPVIGGIDRRKRERNMKTGRDHLILWTLVLLPIIVAVAVPVIAAIRNILR